MKKISPMKKIRLIVIMCIIGCGFHAVPAAAKMQPASSIKVDLVLKVEDRDKAADAIVASATLVNGYFIEKASNGVKLKVPADKVKHIIDTASKQGQLIQRKIVRRDLARKLLKKRAALKAKQSVRSQYETILLQADVKGLLYVEKELLKLVSEIEILKGAIRFFEHRIRFAEIKVSFQYENRAAPVATGKSSFAWLNTINLKDLLRDF